MSRRVDIIESTSRYNQVDESIQSSRRFDKIDSISRVDKSMQVSRRIDRVDAIFMGQNRVNESTKLLARFWLLTRFRRLIDWSTLEKCNKAITIEFALFENFDLKKIETFPKFSFF